MTVSSESRHALVRAQALSALSSRAAPEGDHTWVSYRHALRAVGLVDGVIRYLRDLGFTAAEIKPVYPVLLHVEALVYQGDLAYEESQKHRGAAPSTDWKSGIEEILNSYEFQDGGLRTELEELDRYFRDESLVMMNDPAVTDDLVAETCYRRSSDMRLLFRLAYRMTERPGCDNLLRFSRPFLALAEIWNDLASYEADAAADSFNTLRVFGWRHGADDAAVLLQRWMQSLVHDCIGEIAQADRSLLVAQYIAQCVLLENWKARLNPGIAQVGGRPTWPIVRLAHILPRPVLGHLARRQMEYVGDHLDSVMPDMIPDPSRPLPDVGS